MQRIEKAPLQAFVGGHGAAGEEQFRRPALADQARQQCAGAHVGAGQADAGEQKGGAGLRRSQPQVGRQRHHRAGTGANAVDCRYDGLRAGAHGLDQVTGHAGEFEQCGHAHFGQRANDFMHVAARAEIAARAGQHDDLHVGGVVQGAKQVAQLGVGRKGQRILALRAVQRQRGNAVVEGIGEMLRLVGGQCVELRTHGVGRADVMFHAVSSGVSSEVSWW